MKLGEDHELPLHTLNKAQSKVQLIHLAVGCILLLGTHFLPLGISICAMDEYSSDIYI